MPGQDDGDSLHLLAGQEILAVFSQSLYLTVEMSVRMFGSMVRLWGTPEQQAQLLPELQSGKILGAVALSEDALNVINDPLKTEGIRKDKIIRVSGKKSYVVNAPWADWIAVVGRMQDQTAIFLVDKHTNGLQIEVPLKPLGYEAAAIAGIQLDACDIPADRVILPPEDRSALASLRQWENFILMGAGLGMMQAAYTSAKEYANSHYTGGKPIIAYQEVAFKLAEMLTLYQTSQLLAYRAAWTMDKQPREKDGLMLCAKVLCAESAEKVASMALQVLSGQGYQHGNQAADAYACAKYTQIAGTSMEIARVFIGDEALGYK
jgi:alkylation response protein AidB-like acyl-CoA dehydrogenase